MAHSDLTLRDIAEAASFIVIVGGVLLLAFGLLAELVRRRHAHAVLLRVADRLLPAPAQRIAVGMIAFFSAFVAVAGSPPASADGSLREWLSSPAAPTTTTTTAALVPVPGPLLNPQPSTPPVVTPPKPAAPANSSDPRPANVVHTRAGAAHPAEAAPSAPPPVRTDGNQPAMNPSKPTPPAPATAVPSDHVVVVAGDCLWDIAAHVLGPGTSNTAIDRGWRAIYGANRAAVGDDPGLIHPGLVLTLPALDRTP